MCFQSNSASAPDTTATAAAAAGGLSVHLHSFSNTKALRGAPSTKNADRVSFFSRKLSNTSMERVVSVMNDARGMSPVRAEVFISSY